MLCANKNKNKRSHDTNDDDFHLHRDDKNKRPHIAVDGPSHTMEEREQIRVILQAVPHKYYIYWLCWRHKIHYIVIEKAAFISTDVSEG